MLYSWSAQLSARICSGKQTLVTASGRHKKLLRMRQKWINPARRVSSPRVVNLEDLRRLAKQRLPRMVFDYVDGGADAELTLGENCRAFEDIIFRPRHAVAISECDLQTEILGSKISFPIILAPIGYTRLIHARGELAVARAAGAAGVGYIVATFAGHRLEEVKAASSGPLWYQLYLIGGRSVAEAGIERARTAG